MSLNTHSPIPLYQQLADRIRYDIETGGYRVNDKIPSEHMLAKRYAIGRPTVRQATELLVREGLLQRKRGSGTFVLPPTQYIDLFSLAGTSAAFSQSHLPAEIKILQSAMLLNNADAASKIPAVLADKSVYQLKRLSLIEHVPVLLEVIYLDADLFRGIDKYSMEQDSLARIAREVFFLEASSADQSFAIAYPNRVIAKALKVNTSTPLLHVARTLHFGPQQAAIYCDIYCRTDRFHFSQTILTPEHRTLQTEGTKP